MLRRSSYIIERETADFLLLQDLDRGGKSLTNDMEIVVREVGGGLYGRRLFYRDSEGNVDEVIIKDGVFAGFAWGGNNPFGLE